MSKVVCSLLCVILCLFHSHKVWSVEKQNVRDIQIPLSAKSIGEDAFTSFSTLKSQSSPVENDPLRQALGLSNNNKLVQKSVRLDKRGNIHAKYQQYYKDIPVWGESVYLHSSGSGSLRATGVVVKDLDQSSVSSSASYSAVAPYTVDEAIRHAIEYKKHNSQEWSIRHQQGSLIIHLENEAEPRKVFLVNYFAERTITALNSSRNSQLKLAPTRPFLLIDAQTLEVVKEWDGLAHLRIGTGPGGNLRTGLYEYGVDHGHLDVQQLGSTCVMENSNVKTVDLDNGVFGSDAFAFDCTRNTHREINGAYSPLNDAHFFGNLTYDMYQDWLSVAPLTFQLIMRVHYDVGFENAFWDGRTMTFGDGGSIFYPMTGINIASHEIAHGFTEQNSGLIYAEQSGGINEAFSDIAGEAAEYYWRGSVDWLVGSDVMKNLPALRYFENPAQDGVSIGHASDYFPGMDVHFSSGVFNRAFYLLVTNSGWDIQEAFEIFAHANMNHWGPSETYNSAACGVLEASHDLRYNSLEVDRAFQQVGVDCGYLPFIDLDLDSLDDNWELSFGLDPSDPTDANLDADGDGLSNLQEYQLDTSPVSIDTDGDTLSDVDELNEHGTLPNRFDTDGDAIDDGYELRFGLDPLDASDGAIDLDGDGFTNAEEYEFGTNPLESNDRPAFEILSFENGVPSSWTQPSSSDASWELDTSTAQSGIYSLRASTITHSETAEIEFTEDFVANSLSFWFKTSTERNYDFLRVYVDDELVLSQSGTIDWTEYQVSIPGGEHTIRFVYAKDYSVNDGSDTVWIDNIRYIFADNDSDGIPNAWEELYGLDPNDSEDAQSDFDADGLINFDEYVLGTNPTLPDSDSDGLNDSDEVNIFGTSPSSFDTDGDLIDDGYEVQLGLDPLDNSDGGEDLDGDGFSNSEEYELGTDPLDSTDRPAVRIFSFEDALIPNSWTQPATANAGWMIDASVAQSGAFSLRAEEIGRSSSAEIEFTAEFVANSLSFWSRTSTERCCDRLQVYVDDVRVLDRRGELDWEEHQIAIAAGIHTIRFSYTKDGSVDTGSDTVWIDNIRYVVPQPDLDSDAIRDAWEELYGLDLNDPDDAYADLDSDGLSNIQEFLLGLNPVAADSDGDGVSDGYEVRFGLDPLDILDGSQDPDGDGLTNLAEFLLNTSPMLADTDHDGVIDSLDAFALNNAAADDGDGDGLPDRWNDTCDRFCRDGSGLILDSSLSDIDNDGLPDDMDSDNSADNFGPNIILPSDIVIVATGDLTRVDFGQAIAVDIIDGIVSVSTDHDNLLEPGLHLIEWTATDLSGNVSSATQRVEIVPLVSFTVETQTVNEGQTVIVTARLNGQAPRYPVFVPFNVLDSGSASASEDHDASDGVFVFADDSETLLESSYEFRVLQYSANDELSENIVIELVDSNDEGVIQNAAIGDINRQIVDISPTAVGSDTAERSDAGGSSGGGFLSPIETVVLFLMAGFVYRRRKIESHF